MSSLGGSPLYPLLKKKTKEPKSRSKEPQKESDPSQRIGIKQRPAYKYSPLNEDAGEIRVMRYYQGKPRCRVDFGSHISNEEFEKLLSDS
ncbi:hypothetical protein OCU04_005158 [Sclerotinia nivalis]|uniref:Uncharacterized protein n=1 Tax=Sclerotinia nivalis TaxID=352851 RepID=A0A9X0ANJ5_9HELO|nr:hypothetical protein OCU04_005158 [Sclerotinia nivalis]